MNYAPLAFVLLAGCASVADLQMSSVDREGVSTKPVDEVSRCLSFKTTNAPITDKVGNPLFVVKNGYQAPIGTITLLPFNGGTKVQVRQANGLVQFGDWRKCL